MADSNFLDKGIEIVKSATEADKRKDYEEAFKLYNQALKYFMTALKYEKNPSYKDTIRQKAEEYMKRAEELKLHLESSKSKKTAAAEGGKGGDPDSDEIAKFRSDLEGTILNSSPNVRWDDVAGLEYAKDMLKEAVILPMKFPHMFRGKRKPWKGILLYGPPGTGKSYLAKAVATEANATFFAVGNADLVSKWLGEGEKLVKALFQLARANAPSVIFIDEIDSMMASRNEKASETANRMLNTFLTEMDGIERDGDENKRVLVLGATNIPWTLDAAVMRRFQKRIFIDLPDCNARQRIFELHVGDTPHCLTKEDFRYLATKTDQYSGADIATLVQDALMQPVRKVQDATHFKLILAPDRDNPAQQRQYLTPCSPGDPNGREMTWMDIQAEALMEPAVTLRDFEKSLSCTRASLKEDDIRKCKEFTEKYGMDG